MNKKLIFSLARKSVRIVEASLLSSKGTELTAPLKEDMLGAALEGIAIVITKYPQHSDNPTYLIAAAKQKIWHFLLGPRKVKERTKGEILPFLCHSIDAELPYVESQIIPASSSNWAENNQGKIYNLLLNSRSRKGKRGTESATREVRIILLASYGWSNQEIGEDVGLTPDTVKQARRRMTRMFKNVLQMP